MVSLKKALARADSGNALIETAITLPLLMMVVLGIVDFGRLFQQYEVVTNAAREGARVAVLPGYLEVDVRNRVNEYLQAGGLDLADAVPAPDYLDPVGEPVDGPGGSGPCITLVGVTVSYRHPYPFVGGIVRMFGGSSLGTVTLTSTARMRSETAAVPCP